MADAEPWTIKAFPKAARDKALRAAEAANMPVGSWLAQVVARAIIEPQTPKLVYSRSSPSVLDDEQDDQRGG